MEQKAPHSEKPRIRILTKEELRARFGVKREPTLPATPETPPPVRSEGAQLAKETEPKPVFLAQHVYSHVPTWQSPTKFEGWQTYRYSKDILSPRDTWRLENFLTHQHMFSNLAGPPRWQFLPLDDQRMVFTRVVPRRETDRSGRDYLPLAHSLVVPIADFTKLPDGALSLWNDGLYLDDLPQPDDEAVRSGRPSHLEPLKLNPSDTVRIAKPIEKLPKNLERQAQEIAATPFDLGKRRTIVGTDPLEDLIWSVAHAEQLVAEHCCIAIHGDSKEKEQVLRLAFRLARAMPGVDETALSFTTHKPEGDLLPETPFWAVGVTRPVRNKRAIPIDAGAVLESIKALRGDEELPIKAFETRR